MAAIGCTGPESPLEGANEARRPDDEGQATELRYAWQTFRNGRLAPCAALAPLTTDVTVTFVRDNAVKLIKRSPCTAEHDTALLTPGSYEAQVRLAPSQQPSRTGLMYARLSLMLSHAEHTAAFELHQADVTLTWEARDQAECARPTAELRLWQASELLTTVRCSDNRVQLALPTGDVALTVGLGVSGALSKRDISLRVPATGGPVALPLPTSR